MCGVLEFTSVQLQFGNRPQEGGFFGPQLLKSRSLQDISKVVLELPGEPRAGSLKRRISSVEDLMVLATRASEDSKATVVQASQGADGTAEGPAPVANGTSSAALDCVEPCGDPHCDGACSVVEPPAAKTPLQSEVIAVPAAPPPAAALPGPSPQAGGSALAMTSAFFSASQQVPSPPPSPPQAKAPGVTQLPPLAPGAAPASPPKPPSFFESMKGPRPPSLLGFSPPQSPGRLLEGTRSLSLDERRPSCDLGHVAPSSGHLGQGSAAVELFYRLNHARQTVDYVKRQAAAYAPLNRAAMDVWEALELLNTLREYETALLGPNPSDADMPLLDHALQTAEACRLAFPEHDWMALVGLIHGLGKLLAHGSFGAEPQWAVCGESFPVGCRFHTAVLHSQYFQANPDRRRRAYATPTGVYQPGCGLSAVCMSWSGAEYLYQVLARNRTALPAEAMFLIRYQKFGSLLRPGQPYHELLSGFDKGMLPMLTRFRELAAYCPAEVSAGRLEGQALRDHYDALLAKYIPQGTLRW